MEDSLWLKAGERNVETLTDILILVVMEDSLWP